MRDVGIDIAMRELLARGLSQRAAFRAIKAEIPHLTSPKGVEQAWRRRGCGQDLAQMERAAAQRTAAVLGGLRRDRSTLDAAIAAATAAQRRIESILAAEIRRANAIFSATRFL